jgi:nucleotide-binding universal stress UspA family protein
MSKAMNIASVLVPLDGSELAEQALAFGRAIAQQFDAPLHVVSVIPLGMGVEIVDAMRDYLHQIAIESPILLKYNVRRGSPTEQILMHAGELTDPIIVMSTHGRGGVRRWITGSVANQVVRMSRDPVLLVRSGQEVPETVSLGAVMAPVDGSIHSERAAEFATVIAKAFGGGVHLVRVVDTPTVYGMMGRHPDVSASGEIFADIVESMTQEAQAYLDNLAERLRASGVQVRTVLLEGFAGEQLLEYERSQYFQVVVMSTSGRSGVNRAVFGSVAERVLKMGRSPVLMLGPATPVEDIAEAKHANEEASYVS